MRTRKGRGLERIRTLGVIGKGLWILYRSGYLGIVILTSVAGLHHQRPLITCENSTLSTQNWFDRPLRALATSVCTASSSVLLNVTDCSQCVFLSDGVSLEWYCEGVKISKLGLTSATRTLLCQVESSSLNVMVQQRDPLYR